MKTIINISLIFTLAAVTAQPIDDRVISKLGNELRYQYMRGPDGTPHLVDRWLKTRDVTNAGRYNPDRDNVYHLFTRDNPHMSQPLLLGNEAQVRSSNYNPHRRTIYLIHGWISTINTDFNHVLVPAFLKAENVNVIAVDWGVGAWSFGEETYLNTVSSGQSGARFINWLNSVTGSSPANYHVLGYSLGGFQAGETLMGPSLIFLISFKALDPANAAIGSEHFFTPDVATYTEAIHTTGGLPLAQADFYPNGGENMPHCEEDDFLCNHESSFYYMAKSLSTELIGRRCDTLEEAKTGNCTCPVCRLRMGGLTPKTGSRGLYYLRINSATVFSTSLVLTFILPLVYLL